MLSGLKLLLVEDDHLIRETVGELCREFYGLIVHDAGHPGEAVPILSQERIDILLTDNDMPVMNGVDFLEQLQGQYPHMARVLGSGNEDPELVARAEAAGALFIPKPYFDQLEQVLKNAVSRVYTPEK